MNVSALVFAAALSLTCAAAPVDARDTPCGHPDRGVHESGYVRLGGIDQWVAVSGDKCANPLILFLHGGPGNPTSAFAKALYGGWEKEYTLVQWDQRGAGLTFSRSRPTDGDAQSLGQMRDDGLALAAYLERRFGKRKIILMGTSWGSVLGVHMVKARPELFSAYIGTSQVVSGRENERAAYEGALARARDVSDSSATAKLVAIGAPPWTNPRSFGILRRVIRKFETAASDPAPAAWFVPDPTYSSRKAFADYDAAEDALRRGHPTEGLRPISP